MKEIEMEDIILDTDLLLKNTQFKDATKSDTSLIGSDVIVIKKKYFYLFLGLTILWIFTLTISIIYNLQTVNNECSCTGESYTRRYKRMDQANASDINIPKAENASLDLNTLCRSLTNNYRFNVHTKEDISNAISSDSTLRKEFRENATTWLYEALNMYAGNNWTQGNQEKICDYMRPKFDENYGEYWQCMSSSDNSNQIYGSTIYDADVEYIQFDLNDGLSVYIFKPTASNDYRFKAHSKTEIFDSIYSNSTNMKTERKENATTWLYEALQQYAGPNWKQGNQHEICVYMADKFNENYGKIWQCVTSSDNSNTIYGSLAYDSNEGDIEFDLSDGLAVYIFKSPVSNDYRFKVHSKSEIFNSIWSVNTNITTERKENATTWLYEALQQYAGPNWKQGNQHEICLYMAVKFDENYGEIWQCVTSSDNSNTIYGSLAYDTNEGRIHFKLSDGLAVYIFKSPVSNDYRFKVHSKSEIFNSISSDGTDIRTERQEDATTWLYEALQQYAGPNWEQRNQHKICQYMKDKFNENYGKYWQCITSSDNSNTIHGWITYDENEGKIFFQLSDGLAVYIFKAPASNDYQFNVHSKSEIFDSILSGFDDTQRNDNATTWLYEALEQYAGPNWEEGNQHEICQYMTDKFDENYGKEWLCITSSDNSKTIYGSIAYDANEGKIYFALSDGLAVYIFKAPANDDYRFKVHSKSEILNSICSYCTNIKTERKENATTWLYEALEQYAGPNWEQGNQNNICQYMMGKFDENYGKQWQCIISSDTSKTIYGSVAIDTNEGDIYFMLSGGLDVYIFKSPVSNGYRFEAHSKSEIFNSICSDCAYIKTESKENATTWLYEALQQYAGPNWKQGNQNNICQYMTAKFDENYGKEWQCITSSDNSNEIYGSIAIDTNEGDIYFKLSDGLAVRIFKASVSNDYRFKVHSKSEIFNSIYSNGTDMKIERKENATTWLYEALQQYAGPNWKQGNQNEICQYMTGKFDENYGKEWQCVTSSDNSKTIYGSITIDKNEGDIYFKLSDGLAVYIFKSL